MESRGMAAEAVEAIVDGLHRNGGIWGLISVRETPPPSDTGWVVLLSVQNNLAELIRITRIDSNSGLGDLF